LRSAVKSDPFFGEAYGALAEAELRAYRETRSLSYFRSAVEDAQHALRCSPNNASAYRVLAEYNMFRQNYDAALASYSESLTFLPQDPECYLGLALLSLTAGKFEEAAAYASLVHDPKNAESHFTSGLVQQMRQDYTAAEISYQQAQLLGENDSLLITNYMQDVWLGQGDHEKAVRYCQQMLRISPNDYRYHYWIGRDFQLSLQIDKAQQWLEEGLTVTNRAIVEDPSDARAYAYAGLIYSRMGKFSEGEAAITRAIQLDSSSAEILFHAANIYAVQRNKPKARALLEKALQREYNFGELMSPDLLFISRDLDFLPAVTRTIKGSWPKK
jgi:tetratricopeptide (TPR) repeat protein